MNRHKVEQSKNEIQRQTPHQIIKKSYRFILQVYSGKYDIMISKRLHYEILNGLPTLLINICEIEIRSPEKT